MKVILRSVLYCCLLATVARCVEVEVKPQLTKRLSMWLQSRSRRDLGSVSDIERTAESESFVRAEDIRDNLLPHSSSDTNVRTKRSKNTATQSRRKGCLLGTCTVHDLAHRLHQLNNRLNTGVAPTDKISPQGYGRRRRSLPAADRVAQRLVERRRRRRTTSDSLVHKLTALLKRT